MVVWILLWWWLTEGSADAWWIGVPTVAAATYLSWALAPAVGWRFSAWGFARFLPLFLKESLWGAIDVAWRSLHPRLPIAPRIIRYPLRLPSGTSRVFFVSVANLMPGTLAADFSGDVLVVHVIDARQPVEKRLAALEQAVAGMFAIPWCDRNTGLEGEPWK